MKGFLGQLLSGASRTKRATAPLSIQEIDELISRGQKLEDRGDFQGALSLYEEVLASTPDSTRAHLNRGNALKLMGMLASAEAAFRASIEIDPEYAPGYMNLGNLFLSQEAFDSAIVSYRKALELRKDWLEAQFGLALGLSGLGETDAAKAALEKVLDLAPDHAKAATHLAEIMIRQGEVDKAMKMLDAVIGSAPENPEALSALARIELSMADADRAVTHYIAALSVDPENRETASAYLFASQFLVDVTNDEILAEHRRVVSAVLTSARHERRRPFRHGEVLRIGYVSADFRRHSVACFFEPLLRHHDRSVVSVYCYYNHPSGDEITERFRALADGWHDIGGLSDDKVASLIVEDEIDILVDLSGHTDGNRLGVFALSPVALQFTWLGYLSTTGLPAIKYRLCDGLTDPLGVAERWQVEKPARLPHSQWCYQPQLSVPEPSLLPRLHNGYWTFGSFNQSSKLNHAVLRAWAGILCAIPESRLLIVGVANTLMEQRIRQVMLDDGIDTNRLILMGRVPIDDYFATYRDVDVALDTFPYNGATTTCDALIMGVPVVTVAGERPIARGGLSILSTMGLKQWVADSPDALPALLVEMLRDPDELARLRAELPDRMRASPMMDGARFARDLEEIYRTSWENE